MLKTLCQGQWFLVVVTLSLKGEQYYTEILPQLSPNVEISCALFLMICVYQECVQDKFLAFFQISTINKIEAELQFQNFFKNELDVLFNRIVTEDMTN